MYNFSRCKVTKKYINTNKTTKIFLKKQYFCHFFNIYYHFQKYYNLTLKQTIPSPQKTKKRDANKIASLPNISNLSLTYYKNPKYENEANIHTSLAFLQLLLDKDEFEPRYIRTY